jgi:DnaJ-class molecular chaperone
MTPAPRRDADQDAGDDRSVCSPCRGTGTVISSLGGEPHEETCPWCGGTGVFTPGRDAQAAERSSTSD